MSALRDSSLAVIAFFGVLVGGCLPERKASESGGRDGDAGGAPGGAPGGEGSGEVHVLSDPEIERPVGWTMVQTISHVGEDHPATMKVGVRTLTGTVGTRVEREVVHQVLGKDRRRVTVQRDTDTVSYAWEGATSDRKNMPGPLVRRFMLMERTDGVWAGRFESGEVPTPDEQRAINGYARELNDGDGALYPAEARVGQEWVVDVSDTSWGEDATGTIRYRFESVREHRGERCAVLTASLDFRGESGAGAGLGDVAMTASLTIYRSLRELVDLEMVMEGTADSTISPELGTTIKASGPIRWTEQVEVTRPAG